MRRLNVAIGTVPVLVILSSLAAAQGDEQAQVRLRYGVSVRNGAESDLGPGLTYSGVTPNDLSFSAWAWLLAQNRLGLTAAVQREAFSLRDSNAIVTAGALVRANAGVTGRLRFGPARIEAAAGYLFQQLPVFGTVTTPQFTAVQRHGLLLAARALVDIGPVTVEGRFEYPLALAHVGLPMSSSGVVAGGGIRVQLFRTGFVKWGLLADVQWNQDTLTGVDASNPVSSSQSAIRAGLAVDLQWKDPALEEVSTVGSVRVVVRSSSGPLSGAQVALVGSNAPERDIATGAQGEAILTDISSGTFTVRVRAQGFEESAASVDITAGQEARVALQLNAERPKVGGLKLKVVSYEGGSPVVASIDVNGERQETDSEGILSVGGLSPGPVTIKSSASGFVAAEEVVSIVAGSTADVTLTLVPEKQRVPASLQGQVRSARGGRPVAAKLEIRELNRVLSVGAAGTFSIEIPGGTYTIRIGAAGFVTQTKSVTVRDGDQAIFNVDLAPK